MDGKIVYTPDTGFSGMDVFDYTISDGNGGVDTAAVKVTLEEKKNVIALGRIEDAELALDYSRSK